MRISDWSSDVCSSDLELQRRPVTNADFLAFVRVHPEWRRDRVATVLAETRYLSDWAGADRLGDDALPEQPVVQVSWFAASAYCEAQGGRLPTSIGRANVWNPVTNAPLLCRLQLEQ